jgi:hypothetical protein
MSRRIVREPRGLVREDRGISHDPLVRSVAASHAELVRLLLVPGEADARVDLDRELVLLSGAHLRDRARTDRAAPEPDHGRRHVLRVDGDAGPGGSGVGSVRALERSNFTRPPAFVVEPAEPGADLDDLVSDDVLGEIDPVRADVAHRARRPAGLGVEPPVPVVVPEQPILQVRAVDEVDRPERARREERASVLDEREVAIGEADTRHQVRDPGSGGEILRLRQVERQRLLGQDVLPGFERGGRDGVVEPVRRAVVDDVDLLVLEKLGQGPVRAIQTEAGGRLAAPVGGAGHEAQRPRAGKPPQRVHVGPRGEASADDRGGQRRLLVRAHRHRC